jgi:hypothetical protein
MNIFLLFAATSIAKHFVNFDLSECKECQNLVNEEYQKEKSPETLG